MGHIIGAVVADTQLNAQRAAKAVRIQYEELQPIITIQVRAGTTPELESECETTSDHLGVKAKQTVCSDSPVFGRNSNVGMLARHPIFCFTF